VETRAGTIIDAATLVVSVLGFGGAIVTLWHGLKQYGRAEQWKRGEFVAAEVKEFEATPAVRNVMLMIDWSERRINLRGDPDLPPANWPLVTRDYAWKALLPHWVKARHREWRAADASQVEEASEEQRALFSVNEALIRDAYDVFFDRLERFAHYAESGLVAPEEFQPYLCYWIDDLATDQGDEHDARWRATVLTYVHAYRYPGVARLFRDFGHDIGPDGKLFAALGQRMKLDTLRDELTEAARSALIAAQERAESVRARRPAP